MAAAAAARTRHGARLLPAVLLLLPGCFAAKPGRVAALEPQQHAATCSHSSSQVLGQELLCWIPSSITQRKQLSLTLWHLAAAVGASCSTSGPLAPQFSPGLLALQESPPITARVRANVCGLDDLALMFDTPELDH